MKQQGRILELDLLKTFTILVPMIGIHTMYDLTTLTVADGPLEYILNILATPFGAPVFMFCMGMTLGFSHCRDPKAYFRRGLNIFTIGLVLNFFRYIPTAYSASVEGDPNIFYSWAMVFNMDILLFAGMALAFYGLLKKLNLSHWRVLAIGLVMSIIGTLLDGHYTGSYVVNQILGFFYPTPTCCCFPILNWFIIVAAGNVVGWIYRNYDSEKFMRIAFPAGAIITAAYLYLCISGSPIARVLIDDRCYYSMHTPDVLFIILGVAPFMLGLFLHISKFVPQKWIPQLSYPSIHMEQYYCVSWLWIMWIANLLLFIPKASTLPGFLLMWLAITALTTITVSLYVRFLKAPLNNFFHHYRTVALIGIWASFLLFGLWFFTTVHGPYALPY